MALTAFETAEQRLPCRVEQADAGGKVVAAAAEQAVPLQEADHGGRLERDDIWNMIQSQSQKPPAAPAPKQAPYVPAPVRRSSSLLTQKSLEICTESLGSETGSDGFSDADGATDRSCPGSDDDGANGVAAPAMPPRAFPPPLPSLARRTVGSLQMRQHRRDGRLVVEAVPVLSNTLFRAQRRGGRLLLSFADTAAPAKDEGKNHAQVTDQQQADEQTHEEEEEEEEEEGEELQVVDRGTVVEVKVSTQPQAHSSGARVHRPSLVINKFVGAEPVNTFEINDTAAEPQQSPKHPSSSAAAALAAAPALSAAAALPEDDDGTAATPCEGKVLMTTRRRRSKQELLNHMRRCGQLSGQLFIWEPRVATSS